MATVPPPPSKRQKLAAEANKTLEEEAQRIPDNLGNVRVQFVDAGTGKVTGTPVSIPVAQATAKNLEVLVNDLKRGVRCPFCYCHILFSQRNYSSTAW